jgi:DNA-binding SARP family transcriptional activator
VALVPPDAVATRLRLEGNIAITRTWLNEPLEAVVKECQRIAVEAASRGLDHFAAIAHHNAGGVLLQMGRLTEAFINLERAARFWADPPTSPFADNADLVVALLAMGKAERARTVADEAVRRTRPWPRPTSHALYGRAAVRIHDGLFEEAARDLVDAGAGDERAGGFQGLLTARLIEALFLANRPAAEISARSSDLDRPPQDKRYELMRTAARSIAVHTSGGCRGECFAIAKDLEAADARGEQFTASIAAVKVGAVAVEHGKRGAAFAWAAARRAHAAGSLPLLKWWLRRYASKAEPVLVEPGGLDLILGLLQLDADGWRAAAASLIAVADSRDRRRLLEAVVRVANRHTIDLLAAIPGHDVAEYRQRLQYQQAARLYVRTFSGVSVHKSDWRGPELSIEKRRVKGLLGLLAAHSRSPLARDAVIDLLWPDADGDAAVNSLNQAVFQLRRALDPGYRAGDGAEYVISTAEQVALNPALIRTDVDEVLRLLNQMRSLTWAQRTTVADRALDLIRGDFLGDLRYERWAEPVNLAVSVELRRHLLPIAQSGTESFGPDIRARAAVALLHLDPFDESAVLALARALSDSGRAVAARTLLSSFAARLRADFDDEPSPQLDEALAELRFARPSQAIVDAMARE